MAILDARGDQVVIQSRITPRLPSMMQRLRARHENGHWRTAGYRALDVRDAMALASPECTDAFEELEYRVRYGGDPDDVQAALAIKRGMEPPQGVPELRKPLYPYQEQAVAFLHQAGSGILADEPGLGKTLQGIAFAQMVDGPTLVVCPATAKHVWSREIAAACDATVDTINGRSRQSFAGDFVIINFDVLADHAPQLAAAGFTTLIVDEAHRCKNIVARRTKALIQIAGRIKRRLLMSGTLMMNRAEDLYAPLRIVRPQAYPDAEAFFDRYMETKSVKVRVRGRWRSKRVREGSQNLADLEDRMSPFTIRRKLADVRDQLPAIRHSIVHIDLPEDLLPAYRRNAKDIRATELQECQRAMDVCVTAKQRFIADVVEDRMAAGRKILAFSTRLNLLDSLELAYGDVSLRIDGSTPTSERRAIEDQFQTDDNVRLFLGQTRACSEALTLDAADTVIIAEADWSPQANEQAIRRAMRVNTQHPIEVVWLVVDKTVDADRMEVLARKQAEFQTAMGD